MNLVWIGIVLSLLTCYSLFQLAWSARVLRRVRDSFAARQPLSVSNRFVSFCRASQAVWAVSFLVSFALYLENALQFGRWVDEMAMEFAWVIWSMTLFEVSRRCAVVGLLARQTAGPKQLGRGDAFQEDAGQAQMLAGDNLESFEKEFGRRLKESRWIVTALLSFLVTILAIASCVALLSLIDISQSPVGSVLVLMIVVLVTGVVGWLLVQSVVEQRARQAYLLMFLATTIKNKRPLATELALWGDAQSGGFRESLLAVSRDLNKGRSLSDAFAVQPGLLPAPVLLSLMVAEQTGSVAEVLQESADRHIAAIKGSSTSSSASGTCVYLWLLLIVGTAITGYLMYFIVPKYQRLFQDFGTELPGFTQALFALLNEGMIPLLLAMLVLSCVVFWVTSNAMLYGWSESRWTDWLGFGRRREVPRILRRLRHAVAAQVPLDVALKPMVLRHDWPGVRERFERVLGRITAGMNCWQAMRDLGLLRPQDVALLETAERAGNLAWTLDALADSQELRLAHRWRVTLTTVVPMLTLVAGLFVGWVCVAFFLPLMKLINDLT